MDAAVTHNLTAGDLSWDSDGYYTFGNPSWTDITLQATFTYEGGEIGLFPRFYSTDSYVMFVIGNKSTTDPSVSVPMETTARAYIAAHLFNQTIYLDRSDALPVLGVGSKYIITITIKGSNYKVYLNHSLLFNVEYGAVSKGQAALYATKDNTCSKVEAYGPIPAGWDSNVQQVNLAAVELFKLANDDTYVYMENPVALTELWVKQTVAVESKPYSFSLNYQGQVKTRVVEKNGSSMATYAHDFPLASDFYSDNYTVNISAGCTSVDLYLIASTATPVSINSIQFEQSPFSTDYIENTSLDVPLIRAASHITYPSKGNIISDQGSVSLWVKPSTTYSNAMTAKPVLFEYGNTDGYIRLWHENEHIHFTYGTTSIQDGSASQLLQKDAWYHIVATWDRTGLAIYINTTATTQAGLYTFVGSSDLIRVGHSADTSFNVFNGIFDELIIYSRAVTTADVAALYGATDTIQKNQQMLVHSTFDYEISNFNSSRMEISPAPLYSSPVLMTRDDNTEMRKVSYFDPYTGEYRPFNTEEIVYDGISDFLTVGSKNLDTINFKITVKDQIGNLVGDPYRIDGSRIYFALAASQKKALRGQTLYVTYQPTNAYTVDFNIGTPDSFRVNIGKHDGHGMSVTYEGNKFYTDKLATMVELNPLLNPQHEGFLYIAQTSNEITSFRAKATPDDLPADGSSDAVVVIEPLDSNGNFVSNAKLTVKAQRGSMIPSYDPGSIKLRDTAGRYIYRYRSPLIRLSEFNLPELNEVINVIDKSTGLGVQIPITLTLSETYPNEGTVTLEQENWDKVAAYILDKVMANFNKKAADLPSGLGSLLDLNGDGIIDFSEIIWLNDYKLTQTLYQKYMTLQTWYTNNP